MFLKNQSLKFRLTLSYGITAFVLISFAIIFLYYVMTNQAETENENFLSGELQTIANILKLEHNSQNLGGDLKQEIILEPRTNHYNYYARIISPNQHVLIQTPQINNIANRSDFPVSTGLNKVSPLKKIIRHHQQYSLMSLVMRNQQGTHLIEVALNSSETKTLIEKYQYYLWLLLIASVILSILIGALVTKHGLKPINNLNKVLKSLRGDALHQKLDCHSWPIELRQTIQELNNMLKRIDAAFNRLKNFSSDIAHELRTPLNTIICQAEVTLGQPRTGDEYINILASSIEECRKMAKMINDMLLIARSKNSSIILKKQSLSLHKLLKSTATYLQIMAEDKNIQLIIKGDGNLRGDNALLKRVFLNLLINSINYSATDKTIAITLAEQKSTQTVSVEITDQGYGIDTEDLPFIFDRFYRIDHSRAKHIGGTGLGLAIVKSIISSHNGEITIFSKPEIGTTIKIILPK